MTQNPYRALIERTCAAVGVVPPDVVDAMMRVESNCIPSAKSPSNALGLLQVIYKWHAANTDKAAKELGKKPGELALYDPEVNVLVGTRHLKWCYESDGSRSWERAVRKYHSGSADPPADFKDGGGVTSDQHITKFRAALAALQKEPTVSSFTAHTAVGLSKPLYLPSDIIFERKIIPSNRNYVRSNTKRSASSVRFVTRHETANFKSGANADMHFGWLNGNVGNNPKNASGYNCVNDDRKIIHLTPYDEDTWAAGNYEGNHTSDHHELCVHAEINHTKARRIAAALDAAVLYARGLTIAALVQHNKWWGKNCPLLIRQNGLWPSYVNMVADFYRQIVAFVEGGTVVTPPVQVAAFNAGDTLKVLDNLNVRQGNGTNFPVVKTLPASTLVVVGKDGEGQFRKDGTGYTWYNIAFDGGSGWAAADWLALEKAAETKPTTPAPSVGWPYPNPIIPPFWEELQSGGATHIVSEGTLWYRSNDLYRVKKQTKRLRVVGGTESVGPDLKVGDEFRDAAKGQGYDGKAYVITDGLTRVLMDDLEFVIED